MRRARSAPSPRRAGPRSGCVAGWPNGERAGVRGGAKRGVRGSAPLTPTLSPQAGRGSSTESAAHVCINFIGRGSCFQQPIAAEAIVRAGTVTRLARSRTALRGSESRQALWAVIGNVHTGDLLQRTVRLRRVPHQLRGIAVDLVEIGSIGRNPAIARSAGDG